MARCLNFADSLASKKTYGMRLAPRSTLAEILSTRATGSKNHRITE